MIEKFRCGRDGTQLLCLTISRVVKARQYSTSKDLDFLSSDGNNVYP